MNLGTIRARARVLLGEPATGGRWTDAYFNTAINEAQDRVALETKCLKQYAEFTTSAGVCEYDIGEDSLDDFIDISEVWYYTSTSTYDILRCVSRDELSYIQNQTRDIAGYPEVYCYEDRIIEFDVETEADKICRVYYYMLPATLTTDTSVSGIPTKFHQTLVYYTCWKFCESDGLDLNRVAYFKNQYMEEIAKMRAVLVPAASTYPAIKDDTGGY